MGFEDALTPDDAALIERVEASNLAAQVEVLAQCGAGAECHCLRIGPAVAAITHARFGRKLNHVVGVAVGSALTESQLSAIEAAYAAIHCPVEIDLYPFADAPTLNLLARRGYGVNAFGNSYICGDLARFSQAAKAGPITVRAAIAGEAEPFQQWSVAGFSVQAKPRPAELLRLLALSAIHRRDTELLIAEIAGQVAGTAAVSIIELGAMRGAYLHLASTLPQFRGRGVQAALLHARLNRAAQLGASFATVTARPATSSARNAERAGFRLAYTKPTFVRA